MSFLDPDSEKVLKYFYDNKTSFTGIGINKIKEQFKFSDEQTATVIKELEIQRFITDNNGYPEGTAKTNAPNNFTPGTLYKITSRGVDYIKKQGEFKETVSKIYNQSANNSKNIQFMNESSNSQQNIGASNRKDNKNKDNSIIQKFPSIIQKLIHYFKLLFGSG